MNIKSIAEEKKKSICLIGFGEAGMAIAKGLQLEKTKTEIKAFDIKTDDPATRITKQKEYNALNIKGCDSAEDAALQVDVAFSLVTASQSKNAALSVATHLPAGSFFFDCNSSAPNTKRETALIFEGKDVHYIDTAIMSPIFPKLHKSPALLSGASAMEGASLLSSLGMNATTVGDEIGRAASIKMVRSIMMKGLEALVLECVLSGRRAGVDEFVLDSLDATYPGFEWKEKAAYMLERVATHGKRRASEMREVAKTVDDLGLMSSMSQSVVQWMEFASAAGVDAGQLDNSNYHNLADALLSSLETRNEKGQEGSNV